MIKYVYFYPLGVFKTYKMDDRVRSCLKFLCLGAQALGLLFVMGVLWEYRALAYPHPAYIFHLHTTAAALFVLLLVFTTSWSIRAQISKPDHRAALLSLHKAGNLVLVVISSITACFMLYKKWSEGKGLLLLVRAPSYHSWSSLLWVTFLLFMVVTGLIIYMPAANATTEQVTRSALCIMEYS